MTWGTDGLPGSQFQHPRNAPAVFWVNKASSRGSGIYQGFKKCYAIASSPKEGYYHNMIYQSENAENHYCEQNVVLIPNKKLLSECRESFIIGLVFSIQSDVKLNMDPGQYYLKFSKKKMQLSPLFYNA